MALIFQQQVRFKQVNRREGLRELVDTNFKKGYLLVAGILFGLFFFKHISFLAM